MIRRPGQTLLLTLAASALALASAAAQTLPWPGSPGAAGGAGAAPSPGAMAPAPMSPAPGGMMAPPMQQGAPQGGGPSPLQQQCLNEFTELRAKAEKLGTAARAAGERKVSREEMCKHITAYAAAEAQWVKFTNDNTAKCGIPPQIPKQLRDVHSHTLTAKKNICATGPAAGAGAPAAPSLSDALGTSRMPVPEGSQSGRGTLDTLTGNAISR